MAQIKVVTLQTVASKDTVKTLRSLLAQAERGEIGGFAYTVGYQTRTAYGATGRFRREPCAGIVACLNLLDALRAIADPDNVK
jgi:hypothetical protein